MRWLLFLSRAAFMCGVFMLLAFSLLFVTWHNEETVSSTIIMAGYGLAMVLLPLIAFLYLVFAITSSKKLAAVPRWLIFSNIVLLIIFLIFTFYINDPYYHQG